MKKLIFISLFTIALADCEDPNQTEYYISCDGGSYQDEVSWNLNPTGIMGGAPYSEYICLSDDNYELRMFDSFGDGWNGNIWSIFNHFNGNLIAQCSLDEGNHDWGQCFFTLGESNQPNCEEMNLNQCDSNTGCEWIEDIETGNCGNHSGDDCELNPECNWNCWSDDDYMGWCTYSCDGGPYEIDNSYCEEIEVLECSEMNQLGCVNDGSCEWVEDSNNYSCSGFSQNQCYQYDECNWTLSYGGSYGEWSYSCSGSYQIDNSYCQEIEVLECSEMNQLGCVYDESCEWVEYIDTGSCSSLSLSVCDLPQYGSCYSDCTNWGDYYNGMFCYGTMYCTGGSYQSDNSYCEEVSFLPGDTNGDGSLNVSDIVLMVDLILHSEYHAYSDMNQDGILNVIDIVELVTIILNS